MSEKIKNKRVIIVDDSHVDRIFLTTCCENLGLEIISVEESAYAALSKIDLLAQHNNIPDLILCDIMMVGMDGYALAEEVRADKRYDGMKLIAVSSDVNAGLVKKEGDKGFDAFHPKPVAVDSLAELIEKVL